MVLKAIKEDLRAVFDRDPAATSWLEVVLTYAGFHALLAYRVSHWLKSYMCRSFLGLFLRLLAG